MDTIRTKEEDANATSPTAAPGVSARNSLNDLNQFGDRSLTYLLDTQTRNRSSETRSRIQAGERTVLTRDEDQSTELC